MVVVTCKGKQTGPDKLACVPRPVLIYLSVVLLPSVRIGIWLLGKKEKKKRYASDRDRMEAYWGLLAAWLSLHSSLGTTGHQGGPDMHVRALLENFWDLLLSLVDKLEGSQGTTANHLNLISSPLALCGEHGEIRFSSGLSQSAGPSLQRLQTSTTRSYYEIYY